MKKPEESGLVVPKIECVFCSVCRKPRSECGRRKRMVSETTRVDGEKVVASVMRDCREATDIVYRPVCIPDDRSFLKQWFPWLRAKVRKKFKRDHERVPDTAQRVCARLLQKEFTARWFYKHLPDDLITKSEAERILGHGEAFLTPRTKKGKLLTHRSVNLSFLDDDYIKPAVGSRGSSSSLWRVSDVLAYAGFDMERYFYSMQSHTIDSDRMLRYLGYSPGDYTKLQSLWRQDKILPYELTEHECPRSRNKVAGAGNKAPPSSCPECSRGLALLLSKGISLDMTNHSRWDGLDPVRLKDGERVVVDPKIVEHVRKMRWNDSYLSDFLRRWQDKNEIYGQPRYIMRQVGPSGEPHGIDAGLLKYVEHIVDNEVVNDFKHLSRTDDMSKMVYNNGVSPGSPDSEAVAFDPDSEDGAPKIVCDADAVADFRDVEHKTDISALLGEASLSAEEADVVSAIDLMEITVKDYARKVGIPVQRVHRIHTTALRKLKSAVVGSSYADRMAREVCDRHGCTTTQLLGPDLFGPPVLARAELFATLLNEGMSEEDMSAHFGYPRERISAAVVRGQRSGRLAL